MAMQECLDAEVAERDAMAKKAEALKQAADNESRAAMEKLQQARQEAAAAAMSAKQELADKQDMVTDLCSTHCHSLLASLVLADRPARCLSRC